MTLPYTFDRTHTALELHELYDDKLQAGDHTDAAASVAGRIMLRRGQGKLVFATLVDSSAKIQLFASADTTDQFDQFSSLSLGDWIGASGKVIKTRKGELSVHVDKWVLLAKTKRQFPDKWHGLADQDMRYRQRYVDLWATEESRERFKKRSKILSLTRRWFEDKGFIEVETPSLSALAGGASALPFETHHNALDMDLFLRIAPELYLKRLVVGGFEKVFEIGKNFRNEGISPRHNPEFTMLEWYEAYVDVETIMQRCEELVEYLAIEVCGSTKIVYDGIEVDLKVPWQRKTMAELVGESVGEKVDFEDEDTIRRLAKEHLQEADSSWGTGKLLMELFEKTSEMHIWGPVFVTEYPKEVSPLARDHRSKPGLTERFESIVAGRELSNGFSELIDPVEQRLRFENQVKKKDSGDIEAMTIDEDYIRALEYGLPPTGGIGIGIDRLVMLLTNASTIKDVILFPTLRPEVQA